MSWKPRTLDNFLGIRGLKLREDRLRLVHALRGLVIHTVYKIRFAELWHLGWSKSSRLPACTGQLAGQNYELYAICTGTTRQYDAISTSFIPSLTTFLQQKTTCPKLSCFSACNKNWDTSWTCMHFGFCWLAGLEQSLFFATYDPFPFWWIQVLHYYYN